MELVVFAVALVAVALVAGVVWVGMPKGPVLKEVAHLQQPAIREMGSQKVLLVRARGDPNQVGKAAFGLLMKTYFRLKGVPKGGRSFQPPRARWAVGENQSADEWEGLYAMPIPDSVDEVPDVVGFGELMVELDRWEYGEVAQILHVGGYDEEARSVRVLEDFIREKGYVIAGLHEEEYLKGPGLIFAGDPSSYLTLIRYPVKKPVAKGRSV